MHLKKFAFDAYNMQISNNINVLFAVKDFCQFKRHYNSDQYLLFMYGFTSVTLIVIFYLFQVCNGKIEQQKMMGLYDIESICKGIEYKMGIINRGLQFSSSYETKSS